MMCRAVATTKKKGSTGNSADELELLDALLDGEKQRWGEFVARYERLIVSCVLKVLRRYGALFTAEDLDDLVADAWLLLLRDDMKKLRQYRRDRGFRLASWIGLIATNSTIDQLRARAADAKPLDDVAESCVISSEESPDARVDAMKRAKLAQAALAQLTAEERAFVHDCFHEERSPEEMARERGVSINTVYSRKFKLRDKLARILRSMDREAAA
jgi:RNA polymerase sigma-70 factor (ECF subfamily)